MSWKRVWGQLTVRGSNWRWSIHSIPRRGRELRRWFSQTSWVLAGCCFWGTEQALLSCVPHGQSGFWWPDETFSKESKVLTRRSELMNWGLEPCRNPPTSLFLTCRKGTLYSHTQCLFNEYIIFLSWPFSPSPSVMMLKYFSSPYTPELCLFAHSLTQ